MKFAIDILIEGAIIALTNCISCLTDLNME
jgi:hypothetical protein